MSQAVKVGAETNAWCTSCRLMYEHVVVAMVGALPAKVECAKCHKQHLYRAAPPGTKPPASAATKTGTRTVKRKADSKPEVPAIDLAALTAGREARIYSPAAAYSAGDVVKHPNFGVGVVVLLPGPQKMEVAFREGQKLLAHGRGESSAPQLARPAPRRDDDERRVSDAPPDRPPRSH